MRASCMWVSGMQTARSVAGRWLVKEGGAAPGVEQHSAVPGLVQRRISRVAQQRACAPDQGVAVALALHHGAFGQVAEVDRKSTRLNSSHSQISYAVFCLKKKKN